MQTEKLTKKDLRKFGLIVGSIFIVLFGIIFPFLKSRGFVLWPYVVGSLFIAPALICPLVLKPVHCIWMKAGHILGFINTRLIAVIMFVFIFTPVGIFMRIIRRDILLRKPDKEAKSYLSFVKEYDVNHMQRPF